jgi:DNA-binding beta-propeller fold protein YncE
VTAIKDNLNLIRWPIWGLAVFLVMLMGGPALSIDVPVKLVAQISVDDDGQQLNYPSAVFFDPVMEEIYLVNGGNGRVVVYGPDFFPRGSIGIGRGIATPRGGEVLSSGKVFVVQIRNFKNPVPRITVLNGAFFVDLDIPLDEIAEAEGFTPRQLAISADGLIYLAGDNMRGILVLDNEGAFLRRLQPTDEIKALSADFPTAKEAGAENDSADESEDDEYADIPEEFRPRQAQEDRRSAGGSRFGPVKVNYVKIDHKGRIYLISAETGKIYVYGSDERFLFSFGKKGGSPGQQSQPKALAFDEKRELIYVVDYMRHTILTYNFAGKFLFELGGRGTTPGWFNFPNDITINGRGEIIVADLFNRRVQVLDVGYDASYFKLEDLPPALPLVKPETLEKTDATEGDRLNPGRPDMDYTELAPASQKAEERESPGAELPVEGRLNPDPASDAVVEVELLQKELKPEAPLEFNEQEHKPGSMWQNSQPPPGTLVAEELPVIAAAAAGSSLPTATLVSPGEADAAADLKLVTVADPSTFSAETPDISKVEDFIRFWVGSWQGKNIAAYLSCYGQEFIPAETSRKDWENQRAERIGASADIDIRVRDLKTQVIAEDRVQVAFVQDFRSSTYSDVCLKSLELVWVDSGWAIARETSQPL